MSVTSPTPAAYLRVADPRRWKALAVLACLQFMLIPDATVVNVALPSIKADLGFSQSNLAWVVDAYVLVAGGFLLLGGSVADLFGRRRIFWPGRSPSQRARWPAGWPKTRSCSSPPEPCRAWGRRWPDQPPCRSSPCCSATRKSAPRPCPSGAGSPAWAGVAYVPFGLGVLAGIAAASQLAPKLGVRPLVVGGKGLSAGGLALFPRLGLHPHYWARSYPAWSCYQSGSAWPS